MEHISARLAAFTRNVQYADIPGPVRERAKRMILDAIGCGLAAKRFDFLDNFASEPMRRKVLALDSLGARELEEAIVG